MDPKPIVLEMFAHFLMRRSPTVGSDVGDPSSGPPRSTDLTPCDLFFWGYARSRVYATKPRDLPTLEARICGTCANITPDMLSNVGEACVRKWL